MSKDRLIGLGDYMEVAGMKSAETLLDFDCTSTGVLSLDLAIKRSNPPGGFPHGAITEIVGDFASGKTRVLLCGASEIQHADDDANVFIFDTENAMTNKLIQYHDLDPKRTFFDDPDEAGKAYKQKLPHSMESALERICTVLESLEGKNGAVLLDSAIGYPTISVLTGKGDGIGTDGKKKGSTKADVARVASEYLPKINSLVSRTEAVMLVTNQLRSKIGVMYGPSEDSTGGRGWKFYASLRLQANKAKKMKKDGRVVGITTRVSVIKSRIDWAYQESEFLFMEDGCIIDIGLLEMLVKCGVAKHNSSTGRYDYAGESFYRSEWPALMIDVGKEKLLEDLDIHANEE